tara:strand:- start:159 stop:362 length:204 start_codon:yes stop_codon:yes gene_type:complete
MITRVYFIKASHPVPKGVRIHESRMVKYKSFFRPKMTKVIDEVLNGMTAKTGLSKSGWVIDSFSKVA